MGQCPKCGETTSADHAFCLNCGAELPAAAEAPTSVVAAGEQATAATQASTAAMQPSTDAQTSSAPARPATAGVGRPSAARRGRDGARHRRRTGADSMIPALVALVLSLALQQLINSVVPPDAYLHRLFRPAGGWLMSVVPGLIAFVFIWTITDLLLKLRVARMNESDLRRTDVNQVPAMILQEPPTAALQRLRAWDPGIRSRPVGRRVMWVLQHLEGGDPQRAHELTRHQADLEGDNAASGYRTVRLFIWAMPILGFIGTVLGISLAVGGFSEFLTTNVSIDEIDRVTSELGNVASGLSFAFDTTLLGLLAGLVASVASTAVQAKEERFLTGLEELGLRVLDNAAPEGARGRADGGGALYAADEFEEMMRDRLQTLSRQMQDFSRSVQVGLDGFLAQWGTLPTEVEKAASDLGGLRELLGSAAKSTEKMILETRLLLEGLNEASTQMGNRLGTSIASISQTVDGLGESLGGVSDTLERSLTGLNERVSASEEHLHSGLSNLRQTIESSQRDDAETQRALERLSSNISELSGALDQLRETQNAMVPLLSQLSGPLELRLMPTPVANPQHQQR